MEASVIIYTAVKLSSPSVDNSIIFYLRFPRACDGISIVLKTSVMHVSIDEKKIILYVSKKKNDGNCKKV